MLPGLVDFQYGLTALYGMEGSYTTPIELIQHPDNFVDGCNATGDFEMLAK